MKYQVHIVRYCTEGVTVEAETPEISVQAALEESIGSLCHQCAGRIDLGDPMKAIVTDYDSGDELHEEEF